MKEEQVNHPIHYNDYPIEVIDMMIAVFGKEKTADFCIINAFKYRMRAGLKGDIGEDLKKEKWYLDKHKELKSQTQLFTFIEWSNRLLLATNRQ